MSASDDETKLLGDTVHFLPTINCSNLLTKFMPQGPLSSDRSKIDNRLWRALR